MSMTILHPEQLHKLLASSAIIGAKTAAMMMGHTKDMIMQKEAYARYGNRTVKKWHKAGLLHPKREQNGGSRYIMFPLVELILASQAEITSKLSPMAKDEMRAIYDMLP